MTAEERVASLHERMQARERERKRLRAAALGASCAGVAACLLWMILGDGARLGGTAGLYSGATMVFENAGPFVRTAVLAFAVGVALAAVLLRRREQERRRARRDETPDASLPEDMLAMAAGGQNEEKKPDMPEDHTPKE